MRGELLLQRFARCETFRENENARGFAIESVHDMDAILTFLFQIRVEIRLRRILALALSRDGEKSLRFQNDENVVVFMKQRESGRKRARDRLLRDVDAFIVADLPLRI